MPNTSKNKIVMIGFTHTNTLPDSDDQKYGLIDNGGKRKKRDLSSGSRHIEHLKISNISELKVKYDIGPEIGKGSFGVVLEVKDKFSEKLWAMKVVEKNMKKTGKMKAIQREIEILKLVSHPHIIYLDKVYECSKKIYLVMEMCIGELTTLMKEKKVFTEIEAKKLIRDVVSAVAYLHKNDIVHRDLKLENILLALNPHDSNDEHYIKISDFGLSVIKVGRGLEYMLRDFCGTLTYMSPEILLKRTYSQQCDVWAVGVIMYVMVTGKFPFFSENTRELEKLICNTDPSFDDTHLTEEAINLLNKLLNKNPAVRITAAETLQHPWIVGKLIKKDSPENVLEMMKMWKAEMTDTQNDSDLYRLPKLICEIQSQEDYGALNKHTSSHRTLIGRKLAANEEANKSREAKHPNFAEASCSSSAKTSKSEEVFGVSASPKDSKHSSATNYRHTRSNTSINMQRDDPVAKVHRTSSMKMKRLGEKKSTSTVRLEDSVYNLKSAGTSSASMTKLGKYIKDDKTSLTSSLEEEIKDEYLEYIDKF